jgi:ParB family chromosome partitioning protein
MDTTLEVLKDEFIMKKSDEITEIDINLLDPFANHLFALYTEQRIQELADSIKAVGLEHPIVVRKKNGGRYEILAGHNRVAACRLLNLPTIEAKIKYNVSDDEAERIVLDTNLNQQSFSDWSTTQQIRIIKGSLSYLAEHSRQGKRPRRAKRSADQLVSTVDTSEIDPSETSTQLVSTVDTSGNGARKLKTRDKLALRFGISSSKFEQFRSLATMNNDYFEYVCDLLDRDIIKFMVAFRISQLPEAYIPTVLDIIGECYGKGVRAVKIKLLNDEIKELESDEVIGKEEIVEVIFNQ